MAALNLEQLSKAVAELEQRHGFGHLGADFDGYERRWIELVRRAESAAAVAEINRIIANLARLRARGMSPGGSKSRQDVVSRHRRLVQLRTEILAGGKPGDVVLDPEKKVRD